jgi:hypothetical protein
VEMIRASHKRHGLAPNMPSGAKGSGGSRIEGRRVAGAKVSAGNGQQEQWAKKKDLPAMGRPRVKVSGNDILSQV